jgi:pyruvate/2-oxoglutarate dehydrogenase complex dihydrolipoamide acyltransferase (E2) component
MADLLAPHDCVILEIMADEGTLIAEEDVLAIVERAGESMMLCATTPGVLREWFVDEGDIATASTRLAYIDES